MNKLRYFLEWLLFSWNNSYWREDYLIKICDHKWDVIYDDDIGKWKVCTECGKTLFDS